MPKAKSKRNKSTRRFVLPSSRSRLIMMLPEALFLRKLHTDASVPSMWEMKEDKACPNLERICGMSGLIPESDSNR